MDSIHVYTNSLALWKTNCDKFSTLIFHFFETTTGLIQNTVKHDYNELLTNIILNPPSV